MHPQSSHTQQQCMHVGQPPTPPIARANSWQPIQLRTWAIFLLTVSVLIDDCRKMTVAECNKKWKVLPQKYWYRQYCIAKVPYVIGIENTDSFNEYEPQSRFARLWLDTKGYRPFFLYNRIGSPLRAFQWAEGEHRTLSLSPQRVAQKRKETIEPVWPQADRWTRAFCYAYFPHFSYLHRPKRR